MKLQLLALSTTLLAIPLSAQRQVSIPVTDPATQKTTSLQADLYGRGIAHCSSPTAAVQ